ncbi:muscarinic acetylcholine receptor [Elysia marginata]|uniref:Muscarinic acetylcholine receptor n=1 Tax=Elysia marginata TaxID=1093978 RepID=A0AAV4FWN8_9GAST|nr:muscarinic acetylcholine receptor [Elysia marginata]
MNSANMLSMGFEDTTTLFGLFMDAIDNNDVDIDIFNSSSNNNNDPETAFPMVTLASMVTRPDTREDNSTESPGPTRPPTKEDASTVLKGIILYIIVLITLVGNLFVLLAVYMEKSLQTAFNFFIVNLAITDTCVAATAMSFYATDMMLGYWPFGPVVCAVWIFCDYGMTFASVFTLVAISADRFWSVYWSIQYRSINKRKKSFTMIAVVWVLMLMLWVPALVVDRLNNGANDEDWFCMWDPAENQEFVVVIAIVGHHGPCVLMLAFFFLVYFFLRRRAKLRPMNQPPQVAHGSIMKKEISMTEASADNEDQCPSTVMESTQALDADKSKVSVSTSELANGAENKNLKQPLSASKLLQRNSSYLNVPGNLSSLQDEPSASGRGVPGNPTNASVQDKDCGKSPCRRKNTKTVRMSEATKAEKRNKREMKVFVTLTYIIVGYLICWVPFHVVFDLQAGDPALVPKAVYDVTFWMTYINSTINPFLYNFSSPEFREAFKKIFICSTRWRSRAARGTSTANNQITPSA